MSAQVKPTRAGRDGVFLAIDYAAPPDAAPDSPLLVFMHGNSQDGVVDLTRSGVSMLDWLKAIGHENKVCTVFLQRPGYRSEIGISDGFAGLTGHALNRPTLQHLDYVAGALAHLRALHPRKPLLLAGHSGGALLVSLMLAHHHQLIDAALLSGCPCNPRRRAGLSPDEPLPDETEHDYRLIPNAMPIIVLGGELDTVTPPDLGQRFVEQLQRQGATQARYVFAPGHSHGSLRAESAEYRDAVRHLLTHLRAAISR